LITIIIGTGASTTASHRISFVQIIILNIAMIFVQIISIAFIWIDSIKSIFIMILFLLIRRNIIWNSYRTIDFTKLFGRLIVIVFI
jgi:hypothetical protein